MFLTWLTKYRDCGLLLLRVGLGTIFALSYGWPKLAGGAARWKEIGSSMKYLGVHFAPEMWGLLAALAEFGGGILLILGFLFRPACAALAFTMAVATNMLVQTKGGLAAATHPLELAFVFLALILIGPGRYSIDRS